MTSDANASGPCHLLSAFKWRQDPVRDFTDMAIVLALLDSEIKQRKMNITSISETIGISRATALRRINYFVRCGIVSTRDNGNSRIISLTAESGKFINSLVSTIGCGKLASRVERLFVDAAGSDPA
jgi:predicted transcriptional regulator